MAGHPPSGTVTFLLTDLEGSTRMWEQFPDAMRAAMVRHDELRGTAEGTTVTSTRNEPYTALRQTLTSA